MADQIADLKRQQAAKRARTATAMLSQSSGKEDTVVESIERPDRDVPEVQPCKSARPHQTQRARKTNAFIGLVITGTPQASGNVQSGKI